MYSFIHTGIDTSTILKKHGYPLSISLLASYNILLHNYRTVSVYLNSRYMTNLLILGLIEDDICCIGQNHNHFDCNSYSETW